MADYASFVDYVLRVDELFGDVEDCVSIPRQQLRDRLNPMEHFTDSEFLARYRFTKSSVKKLLEGLPFQESCSNRGHPLPPVMQLLITLRFYGAGTFQVVMGDLVTVSQPTVSRVIERVSPLIAKHLFPAVVNFPNSDDTFRETMVEFYRIAKFSGVTGCIDCTHVRIKSPGVLYGKKRVPGLLLGDAGYPCTSFLMTPMADPPPGSPKSRYQEAHMRTRYTIERAFGAWKRRFPCLDMGLQNLAERSTVITTACAALHNLAVLRQDAEPPPVIIPQHLRRQQPDVANQADTLLGSRCRMRLITCAFTSPNE
ncbi:hypothetical protein HPB51_020605 [Rhipicephalus microplus]|uniref:DDE Tnp4 domain-containing protein n=1 Tax=Rhipicephalus microplus TaxID=6941 RepID=A0A9J6DJ22_RHIMP|nr:hypothetical protein HPB51_020605 [Rhipicephalus microplus]